MQDNKLSIFGGNGFIGENYCKIYPNCIIQKRNDRKPETNNILYFISTVDNYNIFTDITLDVETNLKVLCEVMNNCKENEKTINSTKISKFLNYKFKFDVNLLESNF